MTARLWPCLLCFVAACAGKGDPEGEVAHDPINVVELTVFPYQAGGIRQTFLWRDRDGAPQVNPILLGDASDDPETYVPAHFELLVRFLDDSVDPDEDFTPVIEDDADQYQVFFTGSAVESLATGGNPDAVVSIEYADEDKRGMPLGLGNLLTTDAFGSGELTVTLRHLPKDDDALTKAPGAAESVADGGVDVLPGETLMVATFPLTVQ